MEFFQCAKAVRLRSHHGKYLYADEDEEAVTQDRKGSSKGAVWTVEFVTNLPGKNIIRLKSKYNKYLTPSNQPFLLGMTGKKVLQTLPPRLDSSVEWEPVKEGNQVRLKTRYGQFLRANGGIPLWRKSVTHDIPHRSSTKKWVLWDVDVVEIVTRSPEAKAPPPLVVPSDESSSASTISPTFFREEAFDCILHSPLRRSDGSIIYYQVADLDGNVEEDTEAFSINFKGNEVDELTRKLEEITGLKDIIVCLRSPLDGKLHQLHLQLPPNKVIMNVVLVRPLSNGVPRT